jgi:predicted MFS family arabinose efflux permease
VTLSKNSSAPVVSRKAVRRLRVLRHVRFRRFLVGQSTSLLGSGMSTIGTAFAALQLPGGGVDLVGLVMSARILAVLAVLLLGGVLTDRLGARTVMITADLTRFASQAVLATLLITHTVRIWEIVALAVVLGIGEGGFGPGLTALVPGLVPDEDLTDANSLLGMAQAVASVAGPGLAGAIVAMSDVGTVVAVDAFSYGVSVLALAGLSLVRTATARLGLFNEVGRGWREFTSRTWLWVTNLHMALFNFFLWAPFLVLGPAIAQRRLGGAGSWGLVLALYGCGSVIGGFALLGRNPRRALAWSVAASACWALPVAALATRLPLACVMAAAFPAGVGAAVNGTLMTTVIQREIPADVQGRIGAFDSMGAFALGPLGLALAGPLSGAVGAERLLAFGVAWQVLAVAAVLALPSIRRYEATARPVGDR